MEFKDPGFIYKGKTNEGDSSRIYQIPIMKNFLVLGINSMYTCFLP